MKLKNIKQMKYLLVSLIFIVIFTSTVVASTGTKTIQAVFRNIKIIVDGKLITPKDATGNIVEPFIVNGTTYLPVRAISDALGSNVNWDGDTNTISIEKRDVSLDTTRETPKVQSFTGRLVDTDQLDIYDFSLPYSARVQLNCEHPLINSSDKWHIRLLIKIQDIIMNFMLL